MYPVRLLRNKSERVCMARYRSFTTVMHQTEANCSWTSSEIKKAPLLCMHKIIRMSKLAILLHNIPH